MSFTIHEDWIDVFIGPATFTIEQRPLYCDRGRFTIKVFTSDHTKFYIDYADGFPRYYFFLENLLMELKAYVDFNKDKLMVK